VVVVPLLLLRGARKILLEDIEKNSATKKHCWALRGPQLSLAALPQVPLAEEVALAPGQYQYGFAFVLPSNLPSTFSYEYGMINPCRQGPMFGTTV
jgi:hypothetical protein